MINSGKGMGNSQIGAVGVRRELHVLLLLGFSLLVATEQIGDGVAEDHGPERHDQPELDDAERVVRRQKAGDEKSPRKPSDQWSKDDHRRLAQETEPRRRAPKERHRHHRSPHEDAACAFDEAVHLILKSWY